MDILEDNHSKSEEDKSYGSKEEMAEETYQGNFSYKVYPVKTYYDNTSERISKVL